MTLTHCLVGLAVVGLLAIVVLVIAYGLCRAAGDADDIIEQYFSGKGR